MRDFLRRSARIPHFFQSGARASALPPTQSGAALPRPCATIACRRSRTLAVVDGSPSRGPMAPALWAGAPPGPESRGQAPGPLSAGRHRPGRPQAVWRAAGPRRQTAQPPPAGPSLYAAVWLASLASWRPGRAKVPGLFRCSAARPAAWPPGVSAKRLRAPRHAGCRHPPAARPGCRRKASAASANRPPWAPPPVPPAGTGRERGPGARRPPGPFTPRGACRRPASPRVPPRPGRARQSRA